MNTNNFKLVEVSAKRRGYLRRWRHERAAELLLSKLPDTAFTIAVESDSNETDLDEDTQSESSDRNHGTRAASAIRSFNLPVAGDVFLLPEGCTTAAVFAYVAVLGINREAGCAICAHFSPYSAPAYKDEWLTGIASEPLKVLQLWHTNPIPIHLLARGWRIGKLSESQFRDAHTLYDCASNGQWAPFPLRESTGLAIRDPKDTRLRYQEEQIEIYSPLRSATFSLLEKLESRSVLGEIEERELLAADSGDIIAQVTLLAPDGSVKAALKAEMLSDTSSSYWRIQDWDGALPGTPVAAYTSKPVDGDEPLATTCTTGDDGCQIDLEEEAEGSTALRAALNAGTVWFVVREVD